MSFNPIYISNLHFKITFRCILSRLHLHGAFPFCMLGSPVNFGSSNMQLKLAFNCLFQLCIWVLPVGVAITVYISILCFGAAFQICISNFHFKSAFLNCIKILHVSFVA